MKYILKLFDSTLEKLDSSKRLITTLNAHSYNTLQEDKVFSEALKSSDILLPDGVSMVWASRVLLGKKIKKIAGDDLFYFEMNRVQNKGGTGIIAVIGAVVRSVAAGKAVHLKL